MVCCRSQTEILRPGSQLKHQDRDEMSNLPSAAGDVDQFLVAPRSAETVGELAAFEQALQSVPGASVLQRAGRPNSPRLVVALPAAQADQLRNQFGATLIIERNAPIHPL